MKGKLCNSIFISAAAMLLAMILFFGTQSIPGVQAQLDPWFRVDTYHNVILGNAWTEGTTVTLIIDDPTTGPGVDYTDSLVVPSGTPYFASSNIFFDMGSFQLRPGQFVAISDGETTKELVITTLMVTLVDPDADTISGTADPGAEVEVSAHGEDEFASRWPIADVVSGNWTADFSQPGDGPLAQYILDIVPSIVCFWVHHFDEDGDSTAIFWAYDPHFEVRRTFQAVWSEGWIEEATITLTIDDDDDPGNGVLYTASKVAAPSQGDDHPTSADFWLRGIIDIQAGHIVRINDGISYKEHIVKNPMVLDIDLDAETISGFADPYTSLQVIIWEEPGAERWLTADELGHWTADFSDPIGGDTHDISPGTSGAVFQTDDDTDSTVVDWHVPSLVWMTASIKSDVQDLIYAGVLKPGQAIGLIKPLDNAMRSLKRGKTNAACSQLQDFIDEVNNKIEDGALSLEEGESLIDAANNIRDIIGCDT